MVRATYDIITYQEEMKIRILGFLLVACYSPFAFADGVSISRVLPSSSSSAASTNSASSATTRTGKTDTTVGRATTSQTRATVSNSVSVSTGSDDVSDFGTTVSQDDSTKVSSSVVRVGARTINLENTETTVPTGRTSGNTLIRSRTPASETVTTNARTNLEAAVATVGRNSRVSADSINNNPIVRRAGVSLRPTTAEVGGRAKIAGTDIQTGSNIVNEARNMQSRAATTATRETIAEAKERLEQTADLNKSCQEQYNDCMDQFCAVIDANQKRCSCSSNISKYAKVEEAVKNANTQLNDVAQRIRYVGLSADEIRAILNETEAEEEMSGKTDTSETRNMLTQIEKLIKDPTVSVSSYDSDTTTSLDLDLDFSNMSADTFSLDFLNTSSSSSFSNLRGAELYSAAKRRCNTVITQCKNAGATQQQITGNYDLAIDKDCISYEQGLKKMNETLLSNVKSANLMLQKARLAVLQNKNQYDIKGCISALETCMTDDMVCGEGYLKCVDPTKKFIDENGNVVLGQDITQIQQWMSKYNNATIDSDYLDLSNAVVINDKNCKNDNINDGKCVVKYLLQKIGTGSKATDNGLCRPVLDKCQYYTYRDKQYQKYNDVVTNYIQRALVNIRAAQFQIVSDYASSCMLDVATCYNNQITQVNSWASSASVASIQKVMMGACRNIALTCAKAVLYETGLCDTDGDCLNNISIIFYQSLLCPDNSSYDTDEPSEGVSTNGCNATKIKECYVNQKCYCKPGYTVWGGQCVVSCGANQTRNNYGTCEDTTATSSQ